MKADIIERLRAWVHTVKAVPASDIMDEAAAEIEQLRADWPEHLRLTDYEREAVEIAAEVRTPEITSREQRRRRT
jgi:hypothetical protein